MKDAINDDDLNAIWAAIQELGSALSPAVNLAKPPSWALRLQSALDSAHDKLLTTDGSP